MRKRNPWSCAAVLPGLMVFLSCAACCTFAAEGGFLERTVEVDGEAFKYQVFVPAAWASDDKWPVILFLHGAGERGTDGRMQTTVGLPAVVRRSRGDFPAVMVMPQCRRDSPSSGRG